MTTGTLEKPEILVADEYLKSIFQQAFSKYGLKSGKHGWRAIKSWGNWSPGSMAPLLVAWMLEDVTREKIKCLRELNRTKVHLIFKGQLPSRAVVDRITWLGVRDTKRIHFIKSEENNEEFFVERLLQGLDNENKDSRILDAWWEENTLVVVSPTKKGFNKLHVPLQKLPVLQKFSQKELRKFEIDEDGIFIYWPLLDVHLGWEQFEQAVDQEAYLKAKQQAEKFNKTYGVAIRSLRKKRGLRQSDIRGLTSRQVGRIERGERRATHAAICKLAKAHRMNISDYMDELSKLLGSCCFA